jgi:predicted CXXCH cytochrome family protein
MFMQNLLNRCDMIPSCHARIGLSRTSPNMPEKPATSQPMQLLSHDVCHGRCIRPQSESGRTSYSLKRRVLADYVRTARPTWATDRDAQQLSDDDFATLIKEFRNFDAPSHAITLGISCEACHLGSKEHAAGKLKRPRFFPHGAEVSIHAPDAGFDWGRQHDNLNWACGRCHAGDRPQYAGGMSTWNSTEYTDALRGSCYSQLTCVRCHNPHEAMGSGWSRTPVEDDAICLSCHQQFVPEQPRLAHTRHSLEGSGSRCMNCHMPRINEGLQQVVRTHTIFSPTNAAMIEANHPNACNLCHTEQSIDWTLSYLKEWYGTTYSASQISANYPQRAAPAAIGWLRNNNEAVRLVGGDCLTRSKSMWALPELLNTLNDPFLLPAVRASPGRDAVKLSDHGYRFYQTPEEPTLQRLRQQLLTPRTEAKSAERQLPRSCSPADHKLIETVSNRFVFRCQRGCLV